MLVFLLICIFQITESESYPFNDLIKFINSLNTTWKAGNNFHPSVDYKFLQQLCGARKSHSIYPSIIHDLETNLPEAFDSRLKWPHCPTIREIRDQGSCGSCWAFAAVESMSDRVCIHSSGQINVHLSAENLLTCCKSCGYGCRGADHNTAWEYWVHHGIVSGGAYDSHDGCQPYEFPPCEHRAKISKPNCTRYGPTPSCSKSCRPHYTIPYQKDLNFGEKWYTVSPNEEAIKTEIFRNGPVEASMTTFEDFYIYKSGVYQHLKGLRIGSHAIKIIGWGIEQTTPYWLVSNSFNTDWGDGGYFKMKRGTNECDCEQNITGGLPLIRKLT